MPTPSPTQIPERIPTLPNGDRLPDDLDFFAPPPAEIGTPTVATSTLRKHMKPPSEQFDRAVAGVIQLAFVAIMLAAMISEHGVTPATITAGIVLGLALGTGAGYFVIKHIGRAGFAASVYYLSPHGVARVRCKGDRDQIDLRQAMLFEEETDLLTGWIIQDVQSIHVSADRWFHWTDPAGNTLLLVEAKGQSDLRSVPPESPLHLGELAVRMWLEHRRPVLLAEYRARGWLDFRIAQMGHIRLERGSIQVRFRGDDVRIRDVDITEFLIDNGIFRLRYGVPGATRKPEPIRFACANVANLQVFIELLPAALPGFFSPHPDASAGLGAFDQPHRARADVL